MAPIALASSVFLIENIFLKDLRGIRRDPKTARRTTTREAQVSQGDGAPNGHEVPVIGAGLHDGAHAALQRYLGQDVVPQIAQHAAGVGQLGAAQVDLVVCHHPHEFRRPAARQRRSSGRACGRC